jgi:DNA recombination protein RmuC
MEAWILAVLVATAVGLWLSLRQLERQARSFREELLQLRQETQATLSTQIGQVTQTFTQQLNDVRSTLDKGLATAGQLTSQAQENVGRRLAEATKLVSEVGQQLGGLQEAGRELRTTAHVLETVLSGARTRGALGEVALERLLADGLPQKGYGLQHRFQTGAAVDAVVRVGDKLLPIDSKFPWDAYRRLVEAGDTDTKEQARKEFARTVRKHADDIAEKYILPAEETLELAFMFVASESVYYEVLLTEDSKGGVAEYCRNRHVVPVSPNTLYAYLAVILMGLRGLQVEQNARLLLSRLSGLQADLQGFTEVHGRMGTHLKNASQSYADTLPKLEKLERSLTTLAQGLLPEAVEPEPVEVEEK